MYLLKTISQNQAITKKDLEKRLNEQKVINFIEVKNGKVYLTEKGKKFLKIANLIDKIFGINVFYE